MSVWEPDSELSDNEILSLLGLGEDRVDDQNDHEISEPLNEGIIANRDLRLSDIPDPDATRPGSVEVFAHTINGYDVAGGFAECAEIAQEIADQPEASLTELRCALFFSSRAARHTGIDLDIENDEWLRTLLRRIRQKVAEGDLQ
jgi:hypothetical protein